MSLWTTLPCQSLESGENDSKILTLSFDAPSLMSSEFPLISVQLSLVGLPKDVRLGVKPVLMLRSPELRFTRVLGRTGLKEAFVVDTHLSKSFCQKLVSVEVLFDDPTGDLKEQISECKPELRFYHDPAPSGLDWVKESLRFLMGNPSLIIAMLSIYFNMAHQFPAFSREILIVGGVLSDYGLLQALPKNGVNFNIEGVVAVKLNSWILQMLVGIGLVGIRYLAMDSFVFAFANEGMCPESASHRLIILMSTILWGISVVAGVIGLLTTSQ